MLKLGVNIDHVATLRQARYATMLESNNAEPDIVMSALAAKRGGADSITMHVRGDRRHVQEEDVFRVKEACNLPVNFEMASTAEMVAMALRLRPEFVCLVPENRQEITTEGGLDVAGQRETLRATVGALRDAGSKVSMFIDPEEEQVTASRVGNQLGLCINAGHGINYDNLEELFEIPHLVELNIGHSIVSRAVMTGMEQAVREMVVIMGRYTVEQ